MSLLFKFAFIILVALFCCECVGGVKVYSSFWAPLLNPRTLNYQVDATFDPNAGKDNREIFEKDYGYRGQNLIEDLGNGKGPVSLHDKDHYQPYGQVRFFYTYPGAEGHAKK